MEIPIHASLGNKRDGAADGPVAEGGGFGSHTEADYRKVLEDLLNQVVGKSNYDNAYSTFTMAARSHVQMGMPVSLMFEYQDKLSERYAKLQEPVAPVQNIGQYQNNTIGTNTGTLQGDINKQDIQLGTNPDTNPKLIE